MHRKCLKWWSDSGGAFRGVESILKNLEMLLTNFKLNIINYSSLTHCLPHLEVT